MMRFLAILLLLASPVLAGENPVRQITVTGQAEKNFVPDKADIFVVVEGHAKTLKEAKAKHDRLLNALHAVTAKFGIGKADVKTLSDAINPQYDYVNNPDGGGRRVLREYSAEHRLQVTLGKLDEIGDFINALVAKDIDRVEQVNYGLKNSDDAEMEVSVMAVKDAKVKAKTLLEALDASLGKVLTVSADGGGYVPRPMPMMAKMAGGGADMAMESAASIPEGDVTINRTVTVQFEIQ